METQINTQSDGISFLTKMTAKIAPVLKKEIDLIGTPELTNNAKVVMNSLKLIQLNKTIDKLKENMNQKVNENVPEVNKDEFTKMVKELEAKQEKSSLKQQ